jgi:hypothetical protein
MTPDGIEALHRGKTGKVSDKWASYLPYYDSLFAPWREAPVRLLEIGVQNGGSLETWSRYFRQATLLVGCDIDPRCGNLRYDDARIRIVVGDATGAEAFRAVNALSPRWDIVIDDGSHRSNDIINAFINYFPLLEPGGVFVVEDAHTLYLDDFGGGLLNEFGAMAFFKRLADVVSFQFWQDQASIATFLRTFFDRRSTPAFIVDGWIESVEFRNSIITIRKARSAGHDKLGERVIVGTAAGVQDWGGQRPA